MTITAVFGVDDNTTAVIACQDAADSTAIAVTGITTVSFVVSEAADFAYVVATATSLSAVLAIQEHGDSCSITAIAPTSIIGHGKKFKVHPHDPKSIVVPAS